MLLNAILNRAFLCIVAIFPPALLCSASMACAEDSLDIRQSRLARLRELNRAGDSDLKVINSVLATHWPENARRDVNAELDSAIMALPANDRLNAGAVHYFVEANDAVPQSLVPYLERALPKAELAEKADMLQAIRCVGPRGSKLQAVVRNELDHPSYVIVLYAASALLRIGGDDTRALGIVKMYLGSEAADTQWRAADAIGHAGVKDSDVAERLKHLLTHPDVRVRVTAASALWRLTGDADIAVPVLRSGLSKKDSPLPIGFVGPSRPGDSHRVYIVRAMGDMRAKGVALLIDLMGVLEELGTIEDESVVDCERTALTTLIAIARSGPVSEQEIIKIRAITSREGTVFRRHAHQVDGIVQEISVRM